MAYKTLDAEEAEEKFAQRGTILNMWALKINKKLKPEDEGAEIDDDETKKSKKSGKKTEKEFLQFFSRILAINVQSKFFSSDYIFLFFLQSFKSIKKQKT